MGSLHAAAFAESVQDGQITLEVALHWHLRANHYPPVPVSMVPVCIAAIEAFAEDETDREIELPEGMTYRGRTTAPAVEIVVQHHLDAFLADPEEDA